MFSGKGEVLITHAFPSLHPYAGLHYFSAGGVREWEGGQVGLERKGRRKWVWSGERLEMRDRTRGHMEREVKGMKCERRERSEGESICGRSWLCPKALASLLLLTINISPSHITSLSYPTATSSTSQRTALLHPLSYLFCEITFTFCFECTSDSIFLMVSWKYASKWILIGWTIASVTLMRRKALLH